MKYISEPGVIIASYPRVSQVRTILLTDNWSSMSTLQLGGWTWYSLLIPLVAFKYKDFGNQNSVKAVKWGIAMAIFFKIPWDLFLLMLQSHNYCRSCNLIMYWEGAGKELLCVYPFSREGRINHFGDHRGSIISNRAKTIRRVSAEANMKRFQHKVL